MSGKLLFKGPVKWSLGGIVELFLIYLDFNISKTFLSYIVFRFFEPRKFNFIQSQHIISESKSHYNWTGKFNQPFLLPRASEIMTLLNRYI